MKRLLMRLWKMIEKIELGKRVHLFHPKVGKIYVGEVSSVRRGCFTARVDEIDFDELERECGQRDNDILYSEKTREPVEER